MAYGLRPGGAIIDLTATPVVIDMRIFIGAQMSITSVGQEVMIVASSSPTDTTVLTTATAPSLTAKVPDFFHNNTTTVRVVSRANPFWVMRTLTGNGTVYLNPATPVSGAIDGP